MSKSRSESKLDVTILNQEFRHGELSIRVLAIQYPHSARELEVILHGERVNCDKDGVTITTPYRQKGRLHFRTDQFPWPTVLNGRVACAEYHEVKK